MDLVRRILHKIGWLFDEHTVLTSLVLTVLFFGGVVYLAHRSVESDNAHAREYHTFIVTAGDQTYEAWKVYVYSQGCAKVSLKNGTTRQVCGTYQINDISEPHH